MPVHLRRHITGRAGRGILRLVRPVRDSRLHVDLVCQGRDGVTELGARPLDVVLQLGDAGVGSRLGTRVVIRRGGRS